MEILYNIITATVISGSLSIILVVAEYFFANYGDCKITVNDKKELVVKGGGNLLNALAENKIFIPSACGGRGSCGFCKVKALDGAGPVLPTEKPYLSAKELNNNVRLSCQIKVRQDIKIEIPEELFNIKKFKAKVIEVIDYTYDIKGITFQLLDPDTVDFKAGQYMQLETPKYEKSKQVISRAYSISSIPDNKNALQFIIRRVPDGLCTTWVHDYLKMGDIVNLVGPFGDFYIRDTDTDIIYVAGGSGKAPIKSMVEHAAKYQNPRKMTYFFGARAMKDLYLTEEFQEYEKTMPDFTYVPVLSSPDPEDDWKGKTGFIPPYFKDYIRDPLKTEAYLCGSPGMIAAVEKELTKLGVPNDKIYFDSF
ncbi:MAG: 2Fe-2S iron-sulfur cluster binding domain-containing protein [Candidatus Cloacimonadales bacterium]|jgi:Na+-transporting NADH:ubiquinone oxidoreductase subunit F|nr:2Fe-2S iron-sulfur cluster binding domain-containing protein [Candidatus Cloacimonadota bacterium]MDX9976877.1 2Fe-2S iron-sulfur cluster binding domain-containing protein [Candidatus Cloacimonadales bacterium]